MATETTEVAAGACVGPSGSAIGMPQLCADWIPNQVFWLVIALVATYFVRSRIALPRIASVLAERSGTITNDLAAAEELKLKAQEAEAAYEQALSIAPDHFGAALGLYFAESKRGIRQGERMTR